MLVAGLQSHINPLVIKITLIDDSSLMQWISFSLFFCLQYTARTLRLPLWSLLSSNPVSGVSRCILTRSRLRNAIYICTRACYIRWPQRKIVYPLLEGLPHAPVSQVRIINYEELWTYRCLRSYPPHFGESLVTQEIFYLVVQAMSDCAVVVAVVVSLG